MRTVEAIRRQPVSVSPDATIRSVAAEMERSAVGAVAVVDGGRVVGIVTDRDLVRRALAKGLPEDARIDAVMTTPVVTLDHAADLHEAFALLRDHAVRRIVILDGDQFVGMLTVDDLLVDLSADLADLARPVTAEVLFGHHDPQVPATR